MPKDRRQKPRSQDASNRPAQAMLVQAINVANYIGLAGDVVMQRAPKAMDEMVATIDADPPISVASCIADTASLAMNFGERATKICGTACSRSRGFLIRSAKLR
jgi:hypothetical protein